MSGHMPGPWVFMNDLDIYGPLGGESGDGCKADAADGWNIAKMDRLYPTQVDGSDVELSDEVMKANGRLIAAAPDLLEACEKMVEWDARENDHAIDFYARMELCRKAFNAVRSAIAKATQS